MFRDAFVEPTGRPLFAGFGFPLTDLSWFRCFLPLTVIHISSLIRDPGSVVKVKAGVVVGVGARALS